MNAANVHNFFSAQSFLNGKRRRKLATATYVENRDNGDIAIRYHSTDVVTYHVGGDVSLNSGGWQTVTTKRRMNAHTDYSVWQKKFVWSVGANGDEFAFFDGMRIPAQKSAAVAA